MKKLPGNESSFKLLQVRSSTSRAGNAPKPRGSEHNLFIDMLSILNLGSDERERGSSSMWLFVRFRISRLIKLANPGGMATIKQPNRVGVTGVMYFVLTFYFIVAQRQTSHVRHVHWKEKTYVMKWSVTRSKNCILYLKCCGNWNES